MIARYTIWLAAEQQITNPGPTNKTTNGPRCYVVRVEVNVVMSDLFEEKVKFSHFYVENIENMSLIAFVSPRT